MWSLFNMIDNYLLYSLLRVWKPVVVSCIPANLDPLKLQKVYQKPMIIIFSTIKWINGQKSNVSAFVSRLTRSEGDTLCAALC